MGWRLRLVTSAVLGVVLAASAAGATGVDAPQGKRLAGSISATTAGKTVSRRFAATIR